MANTPELLAHVILSGLFSVGVLLGLRNRGHYHIRKALADQLRPILAFCALGFVCSATLAFLADHTQLKLTMILYWSALAGAIPLLRWLTREALKATREWAQSIIVLSGSSVTSDLLQRFQDKTEYGFELAHTLALDAMLALNDEEIGERLNAHANATLYLAPDSVTQALASRLASALTLKGVSFYYQPAIGTLPTQNFDLLDIPPSEGIVFAIKDSLDRPLAQAIKRGFDIIVTGLGLIALSPVFAALIVLIRRDGGPAFFAQPRVGKDGKVFSCLKFRSMAIDAEARLKTLLESDEDAAREWEIYKKLRHDPRITPVGRWIRKLSLDELPQLINILRGEMSLIGPRPMMTNQIADYGREFEAYKRMRPGLTGLWQVNGRHTTTFAERARLDTWYAHNWSLWRDCVILIRTVKEVLLAKGG